MAGRLAGSVVPPAQAVPSVATTAAASPQAAAMRRRQLLMLPPLLGLAASGAAPAAATVVSESEWSTAAAPVSAAPRPDSLAARIATSGSIQQPGIMPPWAPKHLYYPRWMFGEWQARRGLARQLISLASKAETCARPAW